ncbi:MAG: DMT family transporter [Maritimibacter sp.]|nr:DMT family transporter [Maritimibacter sp.]
MIGSVVSFSAMAVAGRELHGAHDTFEIMLYRSLVGLGIVVAVMLATGRMGQIATQRFGLHLLRNLAHFAGQNLWFYALALVPLAQAFALEFTAPLWALLFAPLVLGEPITRVRSLAALLGFVGVLVVTRPFSAPLTVGVIAAAAAAIGFGFSALFTRRLTRTESLTTILFYLTALQVALGLVSAGYDGEIAPPTLATAPLLALIGIAGLVAHYCLTSALRLVPATVVMPLDFTRLPLIALIGWAVYGERLDGYIALGAALIFAANTLNLSEGARARRAMRRLQQETGRGA